MSQTAVIGRAAEAFVIEGGRPLSGRIQAAGNKPKLIDEYIGRVNSKHGALSVAHMRSPGGWVEPGQTPDFDKFTVALEGALRVTHKTGVLDVKAGEAVVTT